MPGSDCSDGGDSASSVTANIDGKVSLGAASNRDALRPLDMHHEDDAMLKKIPGIRKVHECIGQGEFSAVHRCSMDDHGEVAVKTFSLGVSLRAVLFDLKTLRHPNLVQVIQLHTENPVGIVLELCGPTLFKVLHTTQGNAFPQLKDVGKRVRTGAQLISAVAYLHENEILHRNISSSSCHLSLQPGSDVSFKLGEFTLARAGGGTVMTAWTGTFAYMAPEVMDDECYSYPTDIYASGILLHEIASQKQPYDGSTNPRMMVKVMRGLRPDAVDVPEFDGRPAERRNEFLTLLNLCWHAEPEERPTAHQTSAILNGLILRED